MCAAPNHKRKVKCHLCGNEIELSDRDLRWIDSIVRHNDVHGRPPFNFACEVCEGVFTYDYGPPTSKEEPEPPLQAFHVQQVVCDVCGSPVDIVVMSQMGTATKPWKQSWMKHKPWHRSA